MRVIEIIHPNLTMRTFTVDEKITTIEISKYYDEFKSGKSPAPKVLKLYHDLKATPVIDAVGIDDCNITMQIHEAFESSEKDWSVARDNVFYCLANFFELEYSEIVKAHSIKDNRQKFKEPAVDFDALYRAIAKLKIPHDFETHRANWRHAIECKVSEAKSLINSSETKDETSSGIDDAQLLYWKNELEKFDLAFDALLAMKLPQS